MGVEILDAFSHTQYLQDRDDVCQLNEFIVYRIQLVEHGSDAFRVFTRWGRVGENGQFKWLDCGNLPQAIKIFEKKFREKSGLKWVGFSAAQVTILMLWPSMIKSEIINPTYT